MIKTASLSALSFLFLLSAYSQTFNQVDSQGYKQGKWVKTYQNGQARYEGQFRNNRPYGEFIYYTQDGIIEAKNKFSDDGIIAQSTVYHPNGQLLAEGKYVNQQKEGLWKYYSDLDGELVAEERYKKGLLNGEQKTYYAETGNLFELFHYKDGLKLGTYKKYFPDGSIMTEGNYIDNLLDGEFISYYPDGNIQLRGHHKKGMQQGNWEYFDEGGILIAEDEYKRKSSAAENDSIAE